MTRWATQALRSFSSGRSNLYAIVARQTAQQMGRNLGNLVREAFVDAANSSNPAERAVIAEEVGEIVRRSLLEAREAVQAATQNQLENDNLPSSFDASRSSDNGNSR